MMETSGKLKELIAEHRELNKQIPLHDPKPKKPKPRVAPSELWNRDKRQELSKLAEEFLKAKAK